MVSLDLWLQVRMRSEAASKGDPQLLLQPHSDAAAAADSTRGVLWLNNATTVGR